MLAYCFFQGVFGVFIELISDFIDVLLSKESIVHLRHRPAQSLLVVLAAARGGRSGALAELEGQAGFGQHDVLEVRDHFVHLGFAFKVKFSYSIFFYFSPVPILPIFIFLEKLAEFPE
jgi:hypothetical protein